MSDRLQAFLESLDAAPTNRDEADSFDLAGLLMLGPDERARARDVLVARLVAGITDPRLVDALAALRDPSVEPALRSVLARIASRPPTRLLFALLDLVGADPTAACVTVLTTGELELADLAATRLVARTPERARAVLPGAIRASLLPFSRQLLFDAMVRACGVAVPDYRPPSRLSSTWERAAGWPPSLSLNVAERAETFAADVALGRGTDWTQPLEPSPTFEAALTALGSDSAPPSLTGLTPAQLDYLASRALALLPRSTPAGLEVLVACAEPVVATALRECLEITWMDEPSLAPLRPALARIEAHRPA